MVDVRDGIDEAAKVLLSKLQYELTKMTYRVHSRHAADWMYGSAPWSPCPCDWCHEDHWTKKRRK